MQILPFGAGLRAPKAALLLWRVPPRGAARGGGGSPSLAMLKTRGDVALMVSGRGVMGWVHWVLLELSFSLTVIPSVCGTCSSAVRVRTAGLSAQRDAAVGVHPVLHEERVRPRRPPG